MTLIFLVTEAVSHRIQNEADAGCHRSRLTSPQRHHRLEVAPSAGSQPNLPALSGDLIHPLSPKDTFGGVRSSVSLCGPPFGSPIEAAVDLNDEDVNEKHFSNNDQFCNLINNNNTLIESEYRKVGVPADYFPVSLLDWPLDNGIKKKRLAHIKKQVTLFSNHIKMTIDNESSDDGCKRRGGAIYPFSSYANLALLQRHLDASSAVTAINLLNIEDIRNLQSSGRAKELKGVIRQSPWSINHALRSSLWKELAQGLTKEEFNDSYYWDTVQQVFGSKDMSECYPVLPAFVDRNHMENHALSEDGIKCCKRILAVVAYSFPAITQVSILYPLTATFLHYMDEPEAYNCVSVLLSKGSSFITQTKLLNESLWRTVLTLAKKHVKGSYLTLRKFAPEEQVEEGFKNWSKWIFSFLPFSHLTRVLDCYLLEGSKVLVRCSLALFHLFMKATSRDSNLAASLTTKGFSEAIALFCQNITCSSSKLLKAAFGIRGLSKKEIKKIITQSEISLKNVEPRGAVMAGSSSLEGLPSSQSQEKIQMLSHTLGIKEERPRPQIQLPNIKSSAVSQDELLIIWNWLPMRMTMQHPALIYTTEEHGSSITTFHNRVDSLEPTLLLVRTTNDYVFGAYCSTAWGERVHKDEFGNRQTYFGTGETFLFTIRPKPVKYEWVGITKQRLDPAFKSVSHSEELFMHADGEMLSVGGGHGHGLMLDHEFQVGRTETCQTFGNPPLCPDEHFVIKVVEVYGLSQN